MMFSPHALVYFAVLISLAQAMPIATLETSNMLAVTNKTKCALECAAEAVGVFGACAATCLTNPDKAKCVEERCEAAQLAYELACTIKCGHDGARNTNGEQLNSNHITLAAFDGAKDTTFKWQALNDPVMGGASTSTFSESGSEGVFNGTVRIVQFLKAPGFAKVTTDSGLLHEHIFRDAGAFINGSLVLDVRSSTPGYQGFKAEFGAKNIPSSGFRSGSFKAGFTVSGTEWQTVKIPFSAFSYDWSDYTGRCDTKDPRNGTQHVCCSAEHPEVCPTSDSLSAITSVAVWAEGVAGDFHIEIKSIGAALVTDEDVEVLVGQDRVGKIHPGTIP